ncbi:MAG: hypothetical protein FVQ77_05295, partial [Cytophagales bacterium]|nr:hypothetical protein [Cytophagales bacterium]
QKYVFLPHLIGVSINISLNLLLIPMYGIKGAAFSTLISYFSLIILPPVFIPKIRKPFYMIYRSYLHIFTNSYNLIKDIKELKNKKMY